MPFASPGGPLCLRRFFPWFDVGEGMSVWAFVKNCFGEPLRGSPFRLDDLGDGDFVRVVPAPPLEEVLLVVYRVFESADLSVPSNRFAATSETVHVRLRPSDSVLRAVLARHVEPGSVGEALAVAAAAGGLNSLLESEAQGAWRLRAFDSARRATEARAYRESDGELLSLDFVAIDGGVKRSRSS